jgi:hypothetical protein
MSAAGATKAAEGSKTTAAPPMANDKPKKPEPKTIRLVTTCDLLEPIGKTWFRAGQPVAVDKITGWMQSQINAHLMEVVE